MLRLLVSVFFGVSLDGLGAVVVSMMSVAVGDQSVVGRLFVVTLRVVLGRVLMMLGRLLVMLGCLLVMFGCFLGHVISPKGEGRERNVA